MSHTSDEGQQSFLPSVRPATSHIVKGDPRKRKTISAQAAQHHSSLGFWLTVFTPSRRPVETGAAGNTSGQSNTVTRTGQSGDTQAPTTPGTLSYTQPASGQIRLAWGASTDNVGVTGYNVYANGSLKTTVTGLTYTDSQPDSATVSYYVKARDAAGNESAASNTVTRTGNPGNATNLAVGKPIEASSTVFTFVATNANDNDTATYWEGSAYPANLTVKLGANAALQTIVVKLNPDSSWGTRQQTFSVLGREQSSSAFTTLVGSATYTFNPATGNTVTIPVTAKAADVRLQFTANSGAPGGQVAEFRDMVRTLHAAGIEVILDVVYNHTAEGGEGGPTFSLRGIATDYRIVPGKGHALLDDPEVLAATTRLAAALAKKS